MSKPWTAPPRPTAYDKDCQQIFAAVGSALSSWAYVEDAVASIFELLVCEPQATWTYCNSMSPAKRAYGSVVSFDGRAGMVEAAADAFFYVTPHADLEQRLKDLLKACRGWSGRRNEVAHGQIGGAPTDLNSCTPWPIESAARKRAIDYRAAFVYSSAQIREFDRQFLELHSALLDFFCDFRSWRIGPLNADPVDDPPLDSEVASLNA